MKNVLIVFYLGFCTCTAVQKTIPSSYLVVAGRPTTASKATLEKVLDVDIDNVIAPGNVLVIKEEVYTKNGWRTACMICYQSSVGNLWQVVDSFPLEGGYPQILKVGQPKPDSLVVWVLMCKDLTVTRSYLLSNSVWAPL